MNKNYEDALTYMVSKGYAPHVAAGIIGNLHQESGIDPTAVNSKSGATGIAQWLGPRKSGLNNFAFKQGRSPSDLYTQLDYIDHELNTTETKARDRLMSTNSASDAAVAFSHGFERAGKDERKDDHRTSMAERALNWFLSSANAEEEPYDPDKHGALVSGGEEEVYDPSIHGEIMADDSKSKPDQEVYDPTVHGEIAPVDKAGQSKTYDPATDGRPSWDAPQADYDAYLTSIPGRRINSEGASAFDAAVNGVGQGLTFGFADEMKAALGAALDARDGNGSFTDNYKHLRDAYRSEDKASAEAHPVVHAAASLAGGIAPSLLAPEMGLVKGGAAFGAAYGAGESEAESPLGVAADTAMGAAGGAAFGGALKGTGMALGSAGKWVADKVLPKTDTQVFEPLVTRGGQVLKADTSRLGGLESAVDDIFGSGVKSARGEQEKINAGAARTFIDEFKPKTEPGEAYSKVKESLYRLKKVEDKAGMDIKWTSENIRSALDSLSNKPILNFAKNELQLDRENIPFDDLFKAEKAINARIRHIDGSTARTATDMARREALVTLKNAVRRDIDLLPQAAKEVPGTIRAKVQTMDDPKDIRKLKLVGREARKILKDASEDYRAAQGAYKQSKKWESLDNIYRDSTTPDGGLDFKKFTNKINGLIQDEERASGKKLNLSTDELTAIKGFNQALASIKRPDKGYAGEATMVGLLSSLGAVAGGVGGGGVGLAGGALGGIALGRYLSHPAVMKASKRVVDAADGEAKDAAIKHLSKTLQMVIGKAGASAGQEFKAQ